MQANFRKHGLKAIEKSVLTIISDATKQDLTNKNYL